ncbi:hypothetical protein [Streptomyces lasalocidi]|uniref:Uncharacterized protein n=1 Tax=Streptomyces lasalocidi TaxID=324833 RepID=A0A4U5WND7_STRLS|nr:hypothetical protein [Streptomyces lasalocidi]TKT03728.1 hypothetical protein E4U91_29200 [Streptomyces lasalocidi]
MNHQACENPSPPAAPAPVLSEESADAFAWSMLIELVGHGLAGRAVHPSPARPASARPAGPPAHAPRAAHAASTDPGREAGER